MNVNYIVVLTLQEKAQKKKNLLTVIVQTLKHENDNCVIGNRNSH